MKLAIFGENLNDSKAVKELVLGLRSDLSVGDIKVLRNPPTLTRDAHAKTVAGWAAKAVQALDAARVAGGPIDWVLAHTDADGPDANGAFALARTADLAAAGLKNASAVVPVEAIESWWLLFPAATESVVRTWSGALNKGAFNTDSVSDPKSELIRRTKSKQPKRPYEEADSPAIAGEIAASHLTTKQAANSPSFERFKKLVIGL